MTDAILAVLIIIPVALTVLLKSNAALAVLALTAGYTLESLASSDIYDGLHKLNLTGLNSADIDLLLIALPLLLTLLLTRKHWQGNTKMITQLAAALAAGVMLIIITLPFLGSLVDLNLSSSKIWPVVEHIRGPVIVFGVVYGLFVVWLVKPKPHDKKHK